MKIHYMGSEVLREKAVLVNDIDENLYKFIQEMTVAMDEGKGVGLAAPQVGEKKRLFVVKVPDDIVRVFINPQIIGTSNETGKYEEGCLSIPGIWADVKRPLAVRVQAFNEKGKPFTMDAEGFLARVIQHEYDHLEGILFLDHLNEKKKLKLEKEFFKRQSM